MAITQALIRRVPKAQSVHRHGRGMATLLRSKLMESAVKFPTKDAIRCSQLAELVDATEVEDNAWTQAQLVRNSGAFGNGLLQIASVGSTVLSAIGCSGERVAIQQGAAAASLRLVDCGPNVKAAALKKMLKEQHVRILVITPEQLPTLYEALPELNSISYSTCKTLNIAEFPSLKYVLSTGQCPSNGTHRFQDLMVYNSVTDEVAGISSSPTDPFLIECDASNGKVIRELTQKDVLEESQTMAEKHQIDVDTNVLFSAKNNYATNLCVATLSCVMNNAQLIVPSEMYDQSKGAAAKKKHACSTVVG